MSELRDKTIELAKQIKELIDVFEKDGECFVVSGIDLSRSLDTLNSLREVSLTVILKGTYISGISNKDTKSTLPEKVEKPKK